MGASLPFLTLPDPLVSGEGALDPLGLSMIGDRLADLILPGLRARMSRPRFVTAIAVSAAVCQGLEERFASDGVTPAHLVFEWLVVEAFVLAGKPELTKGTPGTQKAQEARMAEDAMCARTYLKTPTVFGFHGVYKPLAVHAGIVDGDLRLSDRGYELLKIWQSEQGLAGFYPSSGNGPGRSAYDALRSAVEDGLAASCTKRSGGWRGWETLSAHLAPGDVGPAEAEFIHRIFADPLAAPRGEVFGLLIAAGDTGDAGEDDVARRHVLPKATTELAARVKAVAAYERACTMLEEAFDWIRFLSSHSHARPISSATFAGGARTQRLAEELPSAIRAAETALAAAPLNVQQLFSELAKSFAGVRDAESLFESVLAHHEGVQQEKPPEGKRSWFERSPDGATFVRPPYRVSERPSDQHGWNRPYRIRAALSFIADLKVSDREPA